MKTITVAATLLVVLGACSNEHSPANGGAQVAPKTAQAPQATPSVFQKGVLVTTPDFSAPSVTLTIDPNPYSRCDYPNGRAVVSIGYDAHPAGVKHTQLWFQNKNGKQGLWGQGPGLSPPTKTGEWIHDGMKVLLVDVSNNNLLAVQTVHAAECKH